MNFTKENPATFQQVFDIVARHLLTQAGQSKHSTGKFSVCAYRGTIADGPNFGKPGACAVGALIPEDQYDESLETVPARCPEVWSILAQNLGWANEPEMYDVEDRYCAGTSKFIADLLEVHDSNMGEDFSRALRSVAEKYALNTVVLDVTA